MLFIYLVLVVCVCSSNKKDSIVTHYLAIVYSMTFDKLEFKNRTLSEATDSNSLESTSNYTDQADESTQDVESTKLQGRQ